MVQKSSMSRTPSTSTQEIQMDMFDHHPHAQVRKAEILWQKTEGNQTKPADDMKAAWLLEINRLFAN